MAQGIDDFLGGCSFFEFILALEVDVIKFEEQLRQYIADTEVQTEDV